MYLLKDLVLRLCPNVQLRGKDRKVTTEIHLLEAICKKIKK